MWQVWWVVWRAQTYSACRRRPASLPLSAIQRIETPCAMSTPAQALLAPTAACWSGTLAPGSCWTGGTTAPSTRSQVSLAAGLHTIYFGLALWKALLMCWHQSAACPAQVEATRNHKNTPTPPRPSNGPRHGVVCCHPCLLTLCCRCCCTTPCRRPALQLCQPAAGHRGRAGLRSAVRGVGR